LSAVAPRPAAGRRGPDPILHHGAARALIVFVAVIGALYFGLFNRDFSVNGLHYADAVERGVELFHPNHLLPNYLYRGAFLAAQWIGLSGLRSIWIMQTINVIAGLITAAAIVRIGFARSSPRPPESCAQPGPELDRRSNVLLVGALYAVGFAAWNFAEEPDVYILPAAAVAASIAWLVGRDHLRWRDVVGLGALAVFAVLTLQQYVFWYPALLALVRGRDLGAARRAKWLVLTLGVPLTCLAAYLLVGALQGRLHGAHDVLGWFLGYAWNSQSGFGTYRPAPAFGSRLIGTVLGIGNLAFAYEVVVWPIAVALASIASILLLLIALRTLGFLRHAQGGDRRDAAIIAAWSLANLVFATWWESRNIEFLFPLWIGLLALAALAAPALDRRVLAAAVLLVGGINLTVAFAPESESPARYRVAEALAHHERLTTNDVLITEELNTIGYLHYFDRIDVRFQPGAVSGAMHASAPVEQVRAAIDAALGAGARVYTTELDEHGRLRELARWFAPLGRNGFDGAVERDITRLYRGFDTSLQPVPGVRQLRPAPTPP
jgi:hypothetical protein